MSVFNRNAIGSREAGFSLVEILVVVLITAIIMTFSLILFGRASGNYQLGQKASTIAGQIERARSLAVKYNQTLTLGFTSQNKVMDLTCADCAGAKSELPAYTIPTDISLSAYPTLTIKGNGTISTTNASITINDNKGRHVTVIISNSGRVNVGDVSSS
jgi:prepilin-type N-terminal cleavage/methylation domain-containing protein